MNPQQEPDRKQPTDTDAELASEAFSDNRADVNNEGSQEALFKAHLAQLRARQCPGCGESELF